MDVIIYEDVKKNSVLMVDLSKIIYKEEPLFIYDFPYTIADKNIFNWAFYDKDTKPLVRLELLEPLIKAAIDLADQGYKIKIWDAFRPQSVQIKLWDFAIKNNLTHIVANPLGYGPFNPNSVGSCHTKGVAIDITLVFKDTLEELDMGTLYDSSEVMAEFSYNGEKISDQAKRNRQLLNNVLKPHFTVHPHEWWHFDFKGDWLLLTKIKE